MTKEINLKAQIKFLRNKIFLMNNLSLKKLEKLLEEKVFLNSFNNDIY